MLQSNEPIMASVQSLFGRFLLLFLHLGCFAIFSRSNPKQQQDQQQPPPKRRKITPFSPSNLKPHKSFSRSIISYLNLNRFLSFRKPIIDENNQHHHQPQQPPLTTVPLSPHLTPTNKLESPLLSTKLYNFPSTDIFPCSLCGEVLAKPQLLELHQSTMHSLSELRDGDSGKNIVQIIFHSGWKGEPPAIHRILKIHNSPKTLARFEEYREIVRARAARNRWDGDERCIADGNERLRFYCSTVLCSLGVNAVDRERPVMGACGSQYCSTCGIVRHGFAGKQVDLDGIATQGTSWGAHVSLPEELEREFAFLHVRRTVLVCRVVAGRVARGGEEAAEEKKGAVFDSLVPVGRRAEEDELLVFNPRAVLPCFVIIYTAAAA